MMTNTMPAVASANDTDLVSRSLAGDRNAFGEIVARYQSLVCSLAYSATGSLSQSEDLAQETFLTAWKQLGTLREPAKLRAWLCGIARNQINSSFRQRGREPLHRAEPLDLLDGPIPSLDKAPSDEAISKEEEAILWRSLEAIPPLYRDPLVLFYREDQSVERVAEALELSEDAVKQRLSRGRKLLQEQVAAFVEGALVRSVPGKAFTLAVLAALPGLTLSAKAATLAAGTLKSGATAKAAATTGVLGALLTPLLSLLGAWVGYRLNLGSARSDLERDFVKHTFRRGGKIMLLLGVPFVAIMVCAELLSAGHPLLFSTLLIGCAALWLLVFIWLGATQLKQRRQLFEQLEARGLPTTAAPVREYRSRHCFLGLPLVHIRLGGGIAAQKEALKAWIAVGDCAIGGLFAFGGVAIAPISIGGFAVGLVSVGGCVVGPLALGGFAVGYWVWGAIGAGWLSFSACAIAWQAASGGVALAHSYALGGFAQALQANNDAAREFILTQPFFRFGYAALPYIPWFNLLWVLPLWKLWRMARRRNQAG